jgi:hypothetical protein
MEIQLPFILPFGYARMHAKAISSFAAAGYFGRDPKPAIFLSTFGSSALMIDRIAPGKAILFVWA